MLTGGAAVATQGWPAVLGGAGAPAAAQDVGARTAPVTDPPLTQASKEPGKAAHSSTPSDHPTSPLDRALKRAAKNAENTAKKPIPGKLFRLLPPTTEITFRVATINVLGDSHTGRGGNKPGYGSGVARMGSMSQILRAQSLDIIGLQEFEQPQKVAFTRNNPSWSVFTGTERGHDSIAYRADVWDLVDSGTGTIPYFHGRPTPMPWVTLSHRETGQVVSFISIHNPTSNKHRGNNAASRAEATRREVAMVRLLADKGPVFLVGDFNERAEAFCMVTGGGDIIAANGGSQGGSCAPPAAAGIDWIFGTSDITFSDYVRHDETRARGASDHPLVVAQVTVDGILPTSR